MPSKIDDYFMKMALREAEKASSDGEVPTGCVIIEAPTSCDQNPSTIKILGRSHNRTEALRDATAHAEMLALSAASEARRNWRLVDTWLYVTKEPCPMCAGAIVLARVSRVVWALSDPKRGGQSVFKIFEHPGINHHPQFESGIAESESKEVLQSFFRTRRAQSAGRNEESDE